MLVHGELSGTRGLMRIAVLTEAFAKQMGYAGSMLPKYLARLGADVHVVTTSLPPYYNIKDFDRTYGAFASSSSSESGGVELYDGYTLHTLSHRRRLGYVKIEGLRSRLAAIKPDVVQTFAAIGNLPLDAALAKLHLKFRLFTGSHATASVFPLSARPFSWRDREMLRSLVLRALPGRLISLATETCYGATSDCADVAVRFFGVQKRKIAVCPLGVDTDIFKVVPGTDARLRRAQIREALGFADGDVVCIYTGRFSEDKNPRLLARAIATLRRGGASFAGVFFGDGVQRDDIANTPGCVVRPFVPVTSLGDYFRATDVGVWPTQESTSMLDAAACGLPIVVNDTLRATERVSGNGLQYRLNDEEDLVRVLLLLQDADLRRRLGAVGAEKMRDVYSWESIARRRLEDYEAALRRKRGSMFTATT